MIGCHIRQAGIPTSLLVCNESLGVKSRSQTGKEQPKFAKMETATGAWAKLLGARFTTSRCHPANLVSFVLLRFAPLCACPFCCDSNCCILFIFLRSEYSSPICCLSLRSRTCIQRCQESHVSQVCSGMVMEILFCSLEMQKRTKSSESTSEQVTYAVLCSLRLMCRVHCQIYFSPRLLGAAHSNLQTF